MVCYEEKGYITLVGSQFLLKISLNFCNILCVGRVFFVIDTDGENNCDFSYKKLVEYMVEHLPRGHSPLC